MFRKALLSLSAPILLSCQTPGSAPPSPTPATIARPAPAPASQPSTVRRAVGPPPTRRQQVADQIHGQRVPDPYRWLEEMKDPETRSWLAAQDKHARKHLGLLPRRARIKKRLEELSYLERISAPIRRGKRYFFSRQHADKEKVVWYWRQGPRGEPRVLIDPNTLSKDGSVALRGVSISWDGRRMAYKLSQNAADDATLYVMEVGSGEVSKIDVIKGARYAHASWTPKGDGFYYTRLPTDTSIKPAELPGHAAIYFHKLGTNSRHDVLVHPKTADPRTFISSELSRDGRFLFLYILHGWTRTDVYYLDLRKRGPFIRGRDGVVRRARGFKPFAVGLKARFGVWVHKDRFYVLTNLGAPRYRLFKVDPDRTQRSAWREIVPEQKDAVLRDISIVGGRLSLLYLQRASSRLKIASLAGKVLREVALPDIGSTSGLIGNPEDDIAYYAFSSFTTPSTVYRTSVRRGGREVYFRLKAPVDPSPYRVEQVLYRSKDRTEISMFIVRHKQMPLDGTTPFLLGGYGGFNISITPSFRPSRFLWLEHGGGLAIPNLRGGGEYGEDWHQAGMLTRKQNTFDDFIAAAEYLTSRGYTRPERLAIRGGSNGGLLVGAAMTQRPNLFRVVCCHVPLLDMVRYHLFGAGKTWISEYGSAADRKQFRALFAYSPYHRVVPKTKYPALLVASADSDDRVDPMHARKFIAAIQHASSSAHPVLLRVETKSGHGGGDMIKKKVALLTDEFAFLFDQLGMKAR